MLAEKERKHRDNTTQSLKKDKEFTNMKRKRFSSRNKKKKEDADEKKPRRGPRLPNALQKELDLFKRPTEQLSDDDQEIDSDDAVGHDVYEYEEEIPEEESKKNRRFDAVENYEYELPKDFEDWKVASDDEGDDEDEDDNANGNENENKEDGNHARMLENITGLPSDAFEVRNKKDFIISEAYPESEYNPSSDVLDGDGQISIQDLMGQLHGKSGFSKLRKNLQRMEKKSMPTLAPLPKTEQERLERKAAYDLSKKDITKWEPLVKRNREASTLYFDEDVDLRFSTIGAIASDFKPRTDFEKKIASLISQNEVVDAHNKDGARLLELNKISIEDVKNRQQDLAKMRSYLFHHEIRAKRIKKIKSKTYHRVLKKEQRKAAETAIQMDPEAAKEMAMKQEFKRAEERMTLKHKNTSKWAKRILQRGLSVQDEATRAALGEQLNQHAALTRKINSVKESSSSSESSDDDYDSDDETRNSDHDVKLKLFEKAKEETIETLRDDEELPKSGVLSLPFMMRGLQKRKEAADEEAKLALEEYESSLKQLEDKSGLKTHDQDASSGRMVFGGTKKAVSETREKVKINNYYGNSECENDDSEGDDVIEHNQNDISIREVDINHNLLQEEFGVSHDSLFKGFQEAEDPEAKSIYEVAYLASDSWKKVRRSSDVAKQTENSKYAPNSDLTPIELDQNVEDTDEDSDSGGEMVDGILSSGPKSSYKLPSQAELIQRAFAGDDVEEDFEKDKEAVLNEENPEPEKPVLIPGWGQWTDIQKKKGLPSWMVKEHEMAKNKREESLKKRKDARFNNVIISEKLDKKAEKLHTKTLPYPYTSEEVFEQSIRMPIGPEFNPATAVGALNRPEVVKKSGVIIKPIKYEDIIVHTRGETNKPTNHKRRKGKDKNRSTRKISTEV